MLRTAGFVSLGLIAIGYSISVFADDWANPPPPPEPAPAVEPAPPPAPPPPPPEPEPVAEDPYDPRFYVAPMIGYGMYDTDANLDDGFGLQFSVGKALNRYFNLELFGYKFNADAPVGDGDIKGIGLTGLYYPKRYSVPFFLSLGASSVEYASGEGEALDVGAGYIHRLTDHGTSVRAEYRYRYNKLDDLDFGDHLVFVGLEIPIGAKVSTARDKPSDWNNPTLPCPDQDGDGVCDPDDKCPNTPRGVKVFPDGCPLSKEPVVLHGVNFEFDKATLLPESHAVLDKSIEAIKSMPGVNIEVGGHTDSIGSEGYNQNLSQRRVETVVDYLANGGVDRGRLTAKGYGESMPVAPNNNPDGSDNPEGRAQNRRVELKVIGE